jgi:hypothetical protein
VEVVSILLGGVVLLAVALSFVGLVCAIIVLVKMFQNDQPVLAIIGLLVPIVLFVVGWIKAKEWKMTGTMVVWTLSMLLAPVLAGGVVLAAFAGYTLLRGEAEWNAVAPEANEPVARQKDWPADLDPGTLNRFRNRVGDVLSFEVQGNTLGPVYGTDVYTDDSSVATAAVHAGVLKDGERGLVLVKILPGQNSYRTSTHNGVTSREWGDWQGSFRFEGARPAGGGEAVERTVRPDPGTLSDYRGTVGQPLYFEVLGSANGPIWGTDTYTDDSQLATAAVHAGVLKPGQRGTVKVRMLPGQFAYQGSTRHGVATGSYGNWGGSYRVEAAR